MSDKPDGGPAFPATFLVHTPQGAEPCRRAADITMNDLISPVAPARFVTIELAERVTGITQKAMRRKIERCVWAEGIHFRRRDGGVFIDLPAVAKWVEVG